MPGAALIASGMFLLVFAISEGGTYGWLTPIADVDAGPWRVWSASWPISIIPLLFALSATFLAAFYLHERARERADRSPLFEFGLLQHRTFRYGLLTSAVVSMGQLGLTFALALFLQDGKGLTALQNGLWVLPFGLAIIVGAPIAGLAHRPDRDHPGDPDRADDAGGGARVHRHQHLARRCSSCTCSRASSSTAWAPGSPRRS